MSTLTHRPPVPPLPLVPAVAPRGRRNEYLAGILRIVIATLFFAICDVAAKYLTNTLPVVEVVWARYATFALIAILPTLRKGGSALHSRRPGAQLTRAVCLVGSTALFVIGVRSLPIADATAINFASPLFITVLSVLLLHERVDLQRWIAVLVGLVGVLLVARPGVGVFQLATLFPLLSAACWAMGMIITRRLASVDNTATTLAWTAVCGAAGSSVLLPFSWVTPTPAEAGWAIVMGVTFTVGHGLVATAYRKAPASIIAPFSYLQLLNSTVLGIFVFDAIPGSSTLFGGAVIAASGLYIAHRARRS